MSKIISLTEINNVKDGFTYAIKQLTELSEQKEITPWETYNVVSRDEIGSLERYYLHLHGLGVERGSGKIVHKTVIDLEHETEQRDVLRLIRIHFLDYLS